MFKQKGVGPDLKNYWYGWLLWMHANRLNTMGFGPRYPFTEEITVHLFWQCPFAHIMLYALEYECRICY